MEKISVTVKVSALGNTYDFVVPGNMSVSDARNLMIRILSLEYGISEQCNDLALFDMTDGKVLRSECSLEQQGISDGAKLLLI